MPVSNFATLILVMIGIGVGILIVEAKLSRMDAVQVEQAISVPEPQSR